MQAHTTFHWQFLFDATTFVYPALRCFSIIFCFRLDIKQRWWQSRVSSRWKECSIAPESVWMLTFIRFTSQSHMAPNPIPSSDESKALPCVNGIDSKIAKMHSNAKRIKKRTIQQIEIEWEWPQMSCFVAALLTIDVHVYIFDILSDQTIKPWHETCIFYVLFKRISAFLFISSFFSISLVFLFGFVAVRRLPTRHLS